MIGVGVLAPAEAPAAGRALSDGKSGMDDAAFRRFYDETSRPLWAYLARASGSAALADDLLQEAYYRLLRSRFEPASELHRRNYLFRIATNLLRDHFRSPRRREVALEEPSPSPAHGARIEARRDLSRALEGLKPRERQLLWLAHVEGYSHREVAEAMNLKPASVRLLVFRARRRLAAKLRELDPGSEEP